MTRADLILTLERFYPHLPPSVAGTLVSKTFEIITERLLDGRRVEVRGFGAFFVRIRSPRMARNPKTGERVSVGTTKSVAFRAGKQLRDWLNESLETDFSH